MTFIRFETSNGKFIAVNTPFQCSGVNVQGDSIIFDIQYGMSNTRFNIGGNQLDFICFNKDATEEQAKMIVQFIGHPWCAYKDYRSTKNWYQSARESLHSIAMREDFCDGDWVIVKEVPNA